MFVKVLLLCCFIVLTSQALTDGVGQQTPKQVSAEHRSKYALSPRLPTDHLALVTEYLHNILLKIAQLQNYDIADPLLINIEILLTASSSDEEPLAPASVVTENTTTQPEEVYANGTDLNHEGSLKTQRSYRGSCRERTGGDFESRQNLIAQLRRTFKIRRGGVFGLLEDQFFVMTVNWAVVKVMTAAIVVPYMLAVFFAALNALSEAWR